jgi:hypothetical protein
MAEALQSTNVSSPERRTYIWKRGGLMLVFAFFLGLAQTILCTVAVAQFLWLAITSQHNELLANFGSSLSNWMASAGRYITCQSEEKPFPWSSWPSA